MTKEETTIYGSPAIKVGLDFGEQIVLVKKDKYGDNLVYCSSNNDLEFRFTYNDKKTKALDMMLYCNLECCGLISNFDYWYIDTVKGRIVGDFECI